MSVNLYNAERYLDPTAYEALMNIEREAKRTAYKPLVFICSPFAGNIERNTRRARDCLLYTSGRNITTTTKKPAAILPSTGWNTRARRSSPPQIQRSKF